MTQRKIPNMDKAELIGYYVTCLPEAIGWYVQAEYTGHTITKVDTGWRLIVRMTNAQGKWVTFYYAHTVHELFFLFGHDLAAGNVIWRTDLY